MRTEKEKLDDINAHSDKYVPDPLVPSRGTGLQKGFTADRKDFFPSFFFTLHENKTNALSTSNFLFDLHFPFRVWREKRS